MLAARVLAIGIVGVACSSDSLTGRQVQTHTGGAASMPPASGSSGDSGAAQVPGPGGAAGSGGAGGVAGSTTGGASGIAGSTTAGAGGWSPGTGGAPPGSGGFSSGGASIGVPVTPVLPAITGPCPAWQDGAVAFMGLPEIRLAVGPKPAGPTAPMLVYWHGTNSPSDEYLRLAAPVADGIIAAGGVIVSFQGTTGGDALSGTNIFGKGDLPIVDQLVACAIRDHNVDPLRIYTTGCSAGGFFATAMAALRSQYVAAAAPNSGGKAVDLMFADNHTPALMTIHPPSGSLELVDLEKTSHDADEMFKARGGFAIDCRLDSGVCNNALAGDVWTFFLAHPFGAPPDPWAGGLPAGFSAKCQIQ